jgi:hypothetical protein
MVKFMYEIYDVEMFLTIVKDYEPCKSLHVVGVGFEHGIFFFSLCTNNATHISINMKELAIGVFVSIIVQIFIH